MSDVPFGPKPRTKTDLTGMGDYVQPPDSRNHTIARAENTVSLAAAAEADRIVPNLTITFTVREDENGNVIPVEVKGHIPWVVAADATACTLKLRDENNVITAYAVMSLSIRAGVAYGSGMVYEYIDVPGDYERSLWIDHPNNVGTYSHDIVAGIVPFISAEEKPVPLA